MKAVGVVLLVLGILLLAGAATNTSKAPNVSYLIGTFLPGLFCLIVGLKLRQTQKPKPRSRADSEDAQAAAAELDPAKSSSRDDTRPDSFKLSASLGVGCGILLMFLGSSVAQGTEAGLLVGLLIAFGGWAWEVWGCVNYMRWKGYSGWFGLLGYLLLPGLMILLCFPNRRKRRFPIHPPEHSAEMEAVSAEDQRSGYRYLLTLVPLGVSFVILGGFLFFFRSNIDAAEWKEVAPPGLGFQALMPGTPRLQQNAQETPAGKVELHKFSVEPKGKKELFQIVSVRFPEAVSRKLGGTEKLLELGRQDLLSASRGQLQSERQIVLSGFPGLELEVLPPKGAIIRSRIYATKNQIYQVSVHVPKMRLIRRRTFRSSSIRSNCRPNRSMASKVNRRTVPVEDFFFLLVVPIGTY